MDLIEELVISEADEDKQIKELSLEAKIMNYLKIYNQQIWKIKENEQDLIVSNELS